MKIKVLTIISFLISPVFAEVEPASIILQANSNTFAARYDVPPGKVFIIEAVRNQQPAEPVTARISYRNTHPTVAGAFGFSFQVNNESNPSGFAFLERPLRIPAGGALLIPSGVGVVSYFGLLVDTQDLFAANLDVELKNLRIEGSRLMAEAEVNSPRPHRLTVETSEDLAEFDADSTVTITPTDNPKVSTIEMDASAKQKFAVAAATAR